MDNKKQSGNKSTKNSYAKELYCSDLRELRYKTDRTFWFFLPAQWLVTVYVGFAFASPIDIVFPNVLSRIAFASIGGFVILCLPFYRVLRNPGSPWNCYWIAAGQMLISGLFAILTNGAVEAYFHLIASLAVIAFYRQWRVMLFAITLFTVEKVIRHSFLPHSISFTIEEGQVDWVNHLGWLYFTGILLIVSSVRRANEMWAIAVRTAESGAAHARFQAIVQQTDEAVALFEPETLKIIEANDHFRNLIGYLFPDQSSADTDQTALHSDDSLHDLIQGTISSGDNSSDGHFRKEADYKRMDGRDIPIEYSVIQVDVGGDVAISFSARDITLRKKAEVAIQDAHDELEVLVDERTKELNEALNGMTAEIEKRQKIAQTLKNARQFMFDVIDIIPIPVFVKDKELHYVVANKAFAALHGTTVENIIGRRDSDLDYTEERVRQIENEDKSILSEGIEIFHPDTDYENIDGVQRSLQISKRLLKLDEGDVKVVVGVATDFTERKSIESQLRHAQKMESIGQLSAGIAHEINTPTQFVGDNLGFVNDAFHAISDVILGYGLLLESSKDCGKHEELVTAIEENIVKSDLDFLIEEVPAAIEQALEGTSRISTIVRSMRDFAHPGSDEKKAVDLNNSIQSTITVAQNKWKYVADVVTHFDNELPLVPCFAGEINQVVLNMIVNASHAIEDVVGDGSNMKGEINITTRQAEGEWVEVLISDTGGGMPPDVKSKIFDPFFTTKEVGKGTGQGLAISHNVIVVKHFGELSVDSEEGKGTTFTIRLPLDAGVSVEMQGDTENA